MTSNTLAIDGRKPSASSDGIGPGPLIASNAGAGQRNLDPFKAI